MNTSSGQQEFLDYCRSLPSSIGHHRNRKDFQINAIPHLLGYITILTLEKDGSVAITLAGSKTETMLNTYATGQNLMESLAPREKNFATQFHQSLFMQPCAGAMTVVGGAKGSHVTAMECLSYPFMNLSQEGESKPILLVYSRFDTEVNPLGAAINTTISNEAIYANQFQDIRFIDIGFGTPNEPDYVHSYNMQIEQVPIELYG